VADMRQAPSRKIDPTTPHLARVYDYILGGKDNFGADREAGEKLLEVAPDSRQLAHAQRAFLVRSVRFMAEAGVHQFVDLGTGIPTSPNVHEVARSVYPSARVVYVDFDPLVVVHNRALLATDDGVLAIEGDIRRPDGILADPMLGELIDFHEPVGLLMLGVLHSISDEDDPRGIIAQFSKEMAPGSYLSIAQFSDDSEPHAMAQLLANYADTPWPMVVRPREQIRQFFEGFELVPPGLVDVEQWRPDVETPPTALKIPGAVGRKS
jgi:hypothetical protein